MVRVAVPALASLCRAALREVAAAQQRWPRAPSSGGGGSGGGSGGEYDGDGDVDDDVDDDVVDDHEDDEDGRGDGEDFSTDAAAAFSSSLPAAVESRGAKYRTLRLKVPFAALPPAIAECASDEDVATSSWGGRVLVCSYGFASEVATATTEAAGAITGAQSDAAAAGKRRLSKADRKKQKKRRKVLSDGGAGPVVDDDNDVNAEGVVEIQQLRQQQKGASGGNDEDEAYLPFAIVVDFENESALDSSVVTLVVRSMDHVHSIISAASRNSI